MMSIRRMCVGLRLMWKKGQKWVRKWMLKREGEGRLKVSCVDIDTTKDNLDIHFLEPNFFCSSFFKLQNLLQTPYKDCLWRQAKDIAQTEKAYWRQKQKMLWRLLKLPNFVGKDQDDLVLFVKILNVYTKLSNLFFVRKSRVLCRQFFADVINGSSYQKKGKEIFRRIIYCDWMVLLESVNNRYFVFLSGC